MADDGQLMMRPVHMLSVQVMLCPAPTQVAYALRLLQIPGEHARSAALHALHVWEEQRLPKLLQLDVS